MIFADSRESGVLRRCESKDELERGPECSDGGRKDGLSSSECDKPWAILESAASCDKYFCTSGSLGMGGRGGGVDRPLIWSKSSGLAVGN